ncbi:hypothetical protein EHP00_1598 [Ecytonucleospora hepatopenaei]|uniref:Uncharacterized protein n=1 Tax=Ecytonucleospora hepatopenaei TaxID=646526 RepID=A0A1W0E8U8_9MICR|nr:hypothetical protein EHP00_1598 [Ecytonucleospora hepatopenaei]
MLDSTLQNCKKITAVLKNWPKANKNVHIHKEYLVNNLSKAEQIFLDGKSLVENILQEEEEKNNQEEISHLEEKVDFLRKQYNSQVNDCEFEEKTKILSEIEKIKNQVGVYSTVKLNPLELNDLKLKLKKVHNFDHTLNEVTKKMIDFTGKNKLINDNVFIKIKEIFESN